MKKLKQPHLQLVLSLSCLGLLFTQFAAAEDLIKKAPKETALFVKMDVDVILKEVLNYLRVLDPEATGAIEAKTKEVREILKEFGNAYGFQPLLFDRLNTININLIILKKDKPIIKSFTDKYPKWDSDKRKVIPGEFEEHTYTTEQHFTTSLIIRTDAEAAENFLEQFKALSETLKEKDSENQEQYDYKILEVEDGEMLSINKESTHIGRIGRFLVFSDSNPVELWRALSNQLDETLADSETHQRFIQENPRSGFEVQANLGHLIKTLEANLVKELAEAQKIKPDDDAPGQMNYQLMAAQQSLATFTQIKNVLGLDRIKFFGAHGSFTVSDNTLKSQFLAALNFELPLADTTKLLFDGGNKLQPPPLAQGEKVAIVFRLGLQKLYSSIIPKLDPSAQAGVQFMDASASGLLGFTVEEILGLFAGDVYVYGDINNKMTDTYEWDQKTGEGKMVKKMMPAPEAMVLFGIKDAEGFSDTLSKMFSNISKVPGYGALVKKKVYQGTNVYMIGANAGKAGNNPDDSNSFALTSVGRYLAFGNWNDVTTIVRRLKAGTRDAGSILSKTVNEHPDANFLMVVPKSFQQKVNKLNTDKEGNGLAMFKEAVQKLTLPGNDLQQTEKLRAALLELVNSAVKLGEKAQKMMEKNGIIHGQLKGAFYELRSNSNIQMK